VSEESPHDVYNDFTRIIKNRPDREKNNNQRKRKISIDGDHYRLSIE